MGIAGGRMVEIWQEWPRRDSNPHARIGPSVLSRRRLPIPPQGPSFARFILFSPMILKLESLTNFAKPRNARIGCDKLAIGPIGQLGHIEQIADRYVLFVL